MRDYVHKAPDYVALFAYKVISTLEKVQQFKLSLFLTLRFCSYPACKYVTVCVFLGAQYLFGGLKVLFNQVLHS